MRITLSTQSSQLTKKEIANKLHRQFAHASAERIIKLPKKAGGSWNSDTDLHTELQKLSNSCDTCAKYRKPPPRPVLGLPLAT